ncbi:hypothetical protein VTN77DRAFT_1030 [Rasamsonia byssochlamydoides]|uniref:uncharacterized protein n=1 Tax=Rasamsonia byssochlamydoides TaxID=89139 RepID=UPI0037448349
MRFETVLTSSFVIALAAAYPFPKFSTPKNFYISRGPNHQPAKRATGEVVTGPQAVSNINNTDGIGRGQDVYKLYLGDGSTADGWPAMSDWVSFDYMFNASKAVMFSSCAAFTDHEGNPVANNSGEEIGDIYNAIQQVANETKVDHRFILAIMLQESGGCVRAPTTNWGVRNPGLMQDHDGSATCNSDLPPYTVQNPCPADTITQMIREGTAGTPSGDGLAGCLNEAPGQGAQAFYQAARIYNSGSIAASGNLQDGIATHCYASDIANRLTGWVLAPHGCSLDG